MKRTLRGRRVWSGMFVMLVAAVAALGVLAGRNRPPSPARGLWYGAEEIASDPRLHEATLWLSPTEVLSLSWPKPRLTDQTHTLTLTRYDVTRKTAVVLPPIILPGQLPRYISPSRLFALSPDRTRLAFPTRNGSRRNHHWRLVVVTLPVAGQNAAPQVAFETHPSVRGVPLWLSDSRRIYTGRNRSADKSAAAMLISDAQSLQEPQVWPQADIPIGATLLSNPTASEVVCCATYENTGPNRIKGKGWFIPYKLTRFQAKPNGRQVHQAPFTLPPEMYNLYPEAVSPDGRRLLWSGYALTQDWEYWLAHYHETYPKLPMPPLPYPPSKHRESVWLSDLDGNHLHKIIEEPSYRKADCRHLGTLVWTPDSRAVSWVRNGRLYRRPVE